MANVKRAELPFELGDRIKLYMEQRGYSSVASLERDAGLTQNKIRRLVTSNVNGTSLAEITKIADALGVPVAELLGINGGPMEISALNIAPGASQPRWFKVENDEMSPTFVKDDYVMIDQGITEVKASGVYLIKTAADTLVLRRITAKTDGKLAIGFDNTKYAAEGDMLPKDIRIAGKVIGVFSAL